MACGSEYAHESQDGTGKGGGQYAVDDYAKSGERPVLLAEFRHARSADDMGCRAHAYALGKWIDDVTVRKYLESEDCTGQPHAYHDGGCQRGNSSQLRRDVDGNRCGNGFRCEGYDYLFACTERIGDCHDRHNSSDASREFGNQYRHQLLAYRAQLCIKGNAERHDCRTQPEFYHTAALAVCLVTDTRKSQEKYQRCNRYQHRVKDHESGEGLKFSGSEKCQKGNCDKKDITFQKFHNINVWI